MHQHFPKAPTYLSLTIIQNNAQKHRWKLQPKCNISQVDAMQVKTTLTQIYEKETRGSNN